MSRRQQRRRRGTKGTSGGLVRQACLSTVEHLEDRRLLAGEARLIGIAGNQSIPNTSIPDPRNETLYQIDFATHGTTDPTFLEGFEVVPNGNTTLSISTQVGASQGSGSLRVDKPNGQGFWGFRSPNVIDLLKNNAHLLSYEETLIDIELNGGSFGGGADDSFNGFAQSNELAINLSNGEFIQRNFTTGGGNDSFAQNAQWNDVEGTRTITWDLTRFTSSNDASVSLSQYLNNHPEITEARIWFTTQGGDSNGNTGPMRFYFDNINLTTPTTGETRIGSFEPLKATPIIKLDFTPDTQAIGFNPDDGLLYRTGGAESYRNDPNRIGFHDNHTLQTIDLFSQGLPQNWIFNANPQGEIERGTPTGPYGQPATTPTWILPAQRRLDSQTDESFKSHIGVGRGQHEYHAARDLAWHPTQKVFYVADELGLFKLTPGGQSTFVGRAAPGVGDPTTKGHPAQPDPGEDDLKGLAFFTIDGERRLLASERADSATPNLLWTIDPATGQKIGQPVSLVDATGQPLGGVVSLLESPDGTTLYGIAQKSGGPFERELITINPVTGATTTFGSIGIHIADLAFVIPPPVRVTSSNFVYQTLPPRLQVTFNRDIDQATLEAADLKYRLLPGGALIDATEVSYDPATRTATFTLGNTPLADGNYQATLAEGAVEDANDVGLEAATANFFVLAGDANRDRTVGFADLVTLAQNYNQSGKTFAEGDFDYDGTVAFSDLVILAQRYNTTLPAAASSALAAAPAPTPASSTPTAQRKRDESIFNTNVQIKKPAPTPKPTARSKR